MHVAFSTRANVINGTAVDATAVAAPHVGLPKEYPIRADTDVQAFIARRDQAPRAARWVNDNTISQFHAAGTLVADQVATKTQLRD
jgi:hypothetical protein